MGIFYALFSSLFFGLYTIPRKISKLNPFQFTSLMSAGFFVSSLIIFIISKINGNQENLLDKELLYSILAGTIWAFAFICFTVGIEKIGLVQSNQWKNLQGPVGVFLNLFLMGEKARVNPFYGILSGAFIFLSAFVFSKKNNDKVDAKKSGIIYSVISGILFGIVSLINNFVTKEAGVFNQQLIWSLSIFVAINLYLIIRKEFESVFLLKIKESSIPILSGVIYYLASVFMLLAFQQISSSIAFNIIQLNFLVVVFVGIVWFKEFDLKKNFVNLIIGIIFALAGIFMLGLAKGL